MCNGIPDVYMLTSGGKQDSSTIVFGDKISYMKSFIRYILGS